MLKRRAVLGGLLATGISPAVAGQPRSDDVEALTRNLAAKLRAESGEEWRVLIDRKAGLVALSRAS